MVRAGSVLLLLLLAACSATDDAGPPNEGPEPDRPRDLRVERLDAGAPGQGPQRPNVVLAPSAEALSREVGARIPGSGEGTYLAAYWGERSTGGYAINVGGARVEGDRVTVRLLLKGPPSDAIVTTVLTYPFVFAVVRGLDARGKDFSFVDGDGRALDWPVRRADG